MCHVIEVGIFFFYKFSHFPLVPGLTLKYLYSGVRNSPDGNFHDFVLHVPL